MRIIPLLFIGVLILLLLLSGLYRPIGRFFVKLWDDAAGAVMDEDEMPTFANRPSTINPTQ